MTKSTIPKQTPSIDEDIERLERKYGDTKEIPIAETIMRVARYAKNKRAEERR